MNVRFPLISAAAVASPTVRLILLTAGSALLLAAGSVSDSMGSGTTPHQTDSILAPMSAADAAAAQAALDATAAQAARDAIATQGALDATNPILGKSTADTAAANVPAEKPSSLAALVSSIDNADDAVAGDRDMRCLANAVYFESRGEPLEGQLAVAQAILNRVQSGSYASSACAVIQQPRQFSFDHSRAPRAGGAWQTAKAIAMIASEGMWRQIAPRAMSFHANYVSPNWSGKTKIVRIGRHTFYR